jgi:hypothetical protein
MVTPTQNGQYYNLYLKPYVDKKTGAVSPGMKNDETITLKMVAHEPVKTGTASPQKGGKEWTMYPFKVEKDGVVCGLASFDAEESQFLLSVQPGEEFIVHMTKETYVQTKGPQAGQEKTASKLTFKKVE